MSELELRRTLSLQQATLDSTADGLLVVDRDGKIVSYNRRFANMWRIPDDILEARDDDKAIAHVLEQLKEPEKFEAEIRELYEHPYEESYDVLYFRDGRIFERLSRPQLLEGEAVGRVWSFRDVTMQRRAESRLRDSQEKLRSLSARREAELEDERRRISRQVHDGLGQALTAIRLDAEWCLKMLDEKTGEDVARRIRSIVALADESADTVRRIASELRPSVLDDLGLVPAIEIACEDYGKRSSIDVVFSSCVEEDAIESGRRLAVYRIFQEAMTNVVRHAKARHARIHLAIDQGSVTLTVSDDGSGFPLSRELEARSLGLIGMKERARQFGGTLVIDGADPGGTRVTLTLPCGEP